jgi:hypothetical protein
VGSSEPTGIIKKCIESWSLLFPNYKIMLWNEDNIPFHYDYVNNAFINKKWANVSNFVRIYALKNFGGVYFDTDFELIRPFPDEILSSNIFFSFQDDHNEVNNAIMGSQVNHPFLTEMLDYLIEKFDGCEESHLSSPRMTTILLDERGLRGKIGEFENYCYVDDILVLDKIFFHPFEWDSQLLFSDIKSITVGIHHWSKTWKTSESDLKKQILYLKSFRGLSSTSMHFFLNAIKNLMPFNN